MDGKALIWLRVRSLLYQYGGTLFTDKKEEKLTISLGRVGLLLVLGQMVYFWHIGQADSEIMPDGMIEVFLILAGYVFGTKVMNTFDKKWQNMPTRPTKKK